MPKITISATFMPGDKVYDLDDPNKKPCIIDAIIIKKGGLFVYLLTNGEIKYTFQIAEWSQFMKNNSHKS
ncbi:MAG: hypothetical protein A2W93_14290 [Bacteroidetes bacterium GWF2_43_63]|nr:MAG: hypothetical protein A2W94_00860 [Bacteroidetes bacterium GWE2_42_42]OFY52510.1 MAG: hypothetical protein A2W93_14290 [Bacteroidetes bacterium GWF2_43_63]HBG71417.1 hypothetical protein [Bacteroidales bacterium]HCB60831.1 hypothetical protein [Bacteroidales bacterium]HCY23444.1 hypothetical protein [Bacteroidales bacterium]